MPENFINDMLDINNNIINFFIENLLEKFYNNFNSYINDNGDSPEKEKEINELSILIDEKSFDLFKYIREKNKEHDIFNLNESELQIFNKKLLNYYKFYIIKENYPSFNNIFTNKYINNCIKNNIFLCSLDKCEEYNNLYQQLLFLYKNQKKDADRDDEDADSVDANSEDAHSEDAHSEDAGDNNLKKELFLKFLEKSYKLNETFNKKFKIDITKQLEKMRREEEEKANKEALEKIKQEIITKKTTIFLLDDLNPATISISKFINIFTGYLSFLNNTNSLLLKQLILICELKDKGIFEMIKNEKADCVKILNKTIIKKTDGNIEIILNQEQILVDDYKNILIDILEEKLINKNEIKNLSTRNLNFSNSFKILEDVFFNQEARTKDEIISKINDFLKNYEKFIKYIFSVDLEKLAYYNEIKEIVYRTPSIIIKAVDFVKYKNPISQDPKIESQEHKNLQITSNMCNDQIFFYKKNTDEYIKTCIEIKNLSEKVAKKGKIDNQRVYGPYKYIALPLPSANNKNNNNTDFKLYDFESRKHDIQNLYELYNEKVAYNHAFKEIDNKKNKEYTVNAPTNEGIFYNYLINEEQYGLIQKIINKNVVKFFGYGYSGSGKTYTLLEDKSSIFMLSLICIHNLLSYNEKNEPSEEAIRMAFRIINDPIDNNGKELELIKNLKTSLNTNDRKNLYINVNIFYPYNHTYKIDNIKNLDKQLNEEIKKFNIENKGNIINIDNKKFVETLVSNTENSKKFYKQIEDMLLKYGLVIPTSNNPNSSRAFTIVKIVYGTEYLSKENKTLIEIIDLPGLEKKVDMIYEYIIPDTDKKPDGEMEAPYLTKLEDNIISVVKKNDSIKILKNPGEIYNLYEFRMIDKFVNGNKIKTEKLYKKNPSSSIFEDVNDNEVYTFFKFTQDLTNFRIQSTNIYGDWDNNSTSREVLEKKFNFFDRLRFSYKLLLSSNTKNTISDAIPNSEIEPSKDYIKTETDYNNHFDITKDAINKYFVECIKHFKINNNGGSDFKLLISGQLPGSTMIIENNGKTKIINSFTFIMDNLYTEKTNKKNTTNNAYYINNIEIGFENFTNFNKYNNQNPNILFNTKICDKDNEEQYKKLCTNIISMLYNLNISMFDFDYFSLRFKDKSQDDGTEKDLNQDYKYNMEDYNYSDPTTHEINKNLLTSYFSPFLIIPNIKKHLKNPGHFENWCGLNSKYLTIDDYNKAKQFYQDTIDKNLGTIIYYMNYKSQLEYDYKYTIHGNKRKENFTKNLFNHDLEEFLNKTNSTRYEIFEDEDGYMQILDNFYKNFLDDDKKYMDDPTDKFSNFDQVNKDCEYLFKEVFKINTETDFDIGNFDTHVLNTDELNTDELNTDELNTDDEKYNYFYFNKNIKINGYGNYITDTFQNIVAVNTKKYKKNVLSAIAYIFNYIDACYFHDYYEYNLNRKKTQDYNVFPPEFYKHLKILFFSMFLNYILDQGSSIVTSLEHLLYEFLIQQPNGIHEYNEKNNQQPFYVVEIDNTGPNNFSQNFDAHQNNKIKSYLNLKKEDHKNSIDGEKLNLNTLTPKNFTEDKTGETYNDKLYAYANSNYTFKAPMSKLDEIVHRKFIVGMRDALNITDKSRFVNLIAIRRFYANSLEIEITSETTSLLDFFIKSGYQYKNPDVIAQTNDSIEYLYLNNKEIEKRCSAIFESLNFANSLISAKTEQCESENAPDNDKIKIDNQNEEAYVVLAAKKIKEEQERTKNLELKEKKLKILNYFQKSNTYVIKYSLFLSHYYYICKLFYFYYTYYYIKIYLISPNFDYLKSGELFKLDLNDQNIKENIENFVIQDKYRVYSKEIKTIISNITILKYIYLLCSNNTDTDTENYIKNIILLFSISYNDTDNDEKNSLKYILEKFYFEKIFIYLTIFDQIINNYNTITINETSLIQIILNIIKLNIDSDTKNVILKFIFLYNVYYNKQCFYDKYLYNYCEEFFKFNNDNIYNSNTNDFIINYNRLIDSINRSIKNPDEDEDEDEYEDEYEDEKDKFDFNSLKISDIDTNLHKPENKELNFYNLISIEDTDYYNFKNLLLEDSVNFIFYFNENNNITKPSTRHALTMDRVRSGREIASRRRIEAAARAAVEASEEVLAEQARRRRLSQSNSPGIGTEGLVSGELQSGTPRGFSSMRMLSETLGQSSEHLGGSKKKRAKNNFTHKKRKLLLKNKKQKVKNNNASIKKNNISMIIKNK